MGTALHHIQPAAVDIGSAKSLFIKGVSTRHSPTGHSVFSARSACGSWLDLPWLAVEKMRMQCVCHECPLI